MSVSGDTALVGAHDDDIGGNGNQGSAYVFGCLAGCPSRPGRVSTLYQTRRPPDVVHAEWSPEPLSLGGYRLYEVDRKDLIPTAPAAAGSPSCTAPAGSEQCDRPGAVISSPPLVFTQAVGVCSDGTTEGPL